MNAFPFHEDTTGEVRPPVQVFNVRYLSRRRRAATGEDDGAPRDAAGTVLLAASSVLLLVLAIAQGYVSYRAQYSFVHAIKHESAASVLESLGLDCAAVIFALLALAQARLGRPAVAERVLNLACVCGSLVMNAMSADFTDPKSVAVWTLPAALYAAASDRLIAVVRRRALAVLDEGEDRSPLAAAGGAALWVLRFALAPVTTWRGFRAWVLESAPVAPGRRALPLADRPALTAAPDASTDPAPAPSTPAIEATAGTTAGTVPAPPRRRSSGRGAGRSRTRSTTRRRTVPDVDDLMPLGRGIAADLDARHVPLTRDSLAAALREAGRQAGNARVGALLARLKTEPTPVEEGSGS